MNQTHELTFKLPFVTPGNERRMDDLLSSFSRMVDRDFVPNNNLPVLAFIDLGFVSDLHEDSEDNYGLIYSPAMIGRNLHKASDGLYIMNIVLDQWNIQYQKQYTTHADMPYTYFVGWIEVCDDLGLVAQYLYDTWLAKRLNERICAEVPNSGTASSTKKI